MNFDLWAPGTALSDNSEGRHVLNAMCDLTHFIISTINTEIHAEHTKEVFMDNVVLSFVMVEILVVDAKIKFKSVFKDMCAALGIIYWHLVRGNQKVTSIEKYHRFINKMQATAVQDRGTYAVFLQNEKTSQYAWNSTTINGTYILRIFSVIGWEFRFLLDIELLQNPQP